MKNALKTLAVIVTIGAFGLAINPAPVKALVENQAFGVFGVTPVDAQPSGANEAAVGTVTGYTTAATIQQFVVAGHNGAGAVTLTGAPLGATVIGVVNLTSPATAASSFESTLSVAGQIQQSSSSNLSSNTYLVTIASNSTTDVGACATLTNAIRTILVNFGFMKGSA